MGTCGKSCGIQRCKSETEQPRHNSGSSARNRDTNVMEKGGNRLVAELRGNLPTILELEVRLFSTLFPSMETAVDRRVRVVHGLGAAARAQLKRRKDIVHCST